MCIFEDESRNNDHDVPIVKDDMDNMQDDANRIHESIYNFESSLNAMHHMLTQLNTTLHSLNQHISHDEALGTEEHMHENDVAIVDNVDKATRDDAMIAQYSVHSIDELISHAYGKVPAQHIEKLKNVCGYLEKIMPFSDCNSPLHDLSEVLQSITPMLGESAQCTKHETIDMPMGQIFAR